MQNRRAMTVGAALALGAVAAVIAVLLVHNAQTKAAAPVPSVKLVVAAKTIPVGTSGDSALTTGLLKWQDVPKTLSPANAITDPNVIKGKVALAALAPGQILVAGQFVQPQASTVSVSGVDIPQGDVAVTISLDPSRAVAGLVVPGDHIDIMDILPPPKGSDAGPYAHFIYQNALVLAIGTTRAATAGSQPAANPGSSLYTLAVTPEAAERIVLAASGGSVYVALVRADNTPTPIPAVATNGIDAASPSFAPAPALTPNAK